MSHPGNTGPKPDLHGLMSELAAMKSMPASAERDPSKENTAYRRMIIRLMSNHGFVPDDDLIFALESNHRVLPSSSLVGIAYSQEERDVYETYLNEEFLSGVGGRGDVPGEEHRVDGNCLQRVARDLARTDRETYEIIIKVKMAIGLCPPKG